MSGVTYTIELLEPLLATGMTGDPNTKRSLDFIPGSMVRGAAIGLYLQQKEAADDASPPVLDNDDPADRRRFLSNRTRYLNGYPLIDTTGYGDWERTLPVPRSWQAAKKARWSDARKGTATVSIDDFAIAQRAVDGVQRSAVNAPFFLLRDGRLHLHNPERRVALHTARERTMGRATAGEGAVFYYDALAAGQAFRGYIVTATADDAHFLVKLLDGQEWSLGGSRSAGYGRVRIMAEALPAAWRGEAALSVGDTTTDWPAEEMAELTEAEAPAAAIVPVEAPLLQPGTLLQILCLSHCLVRTAEGHLSAELDAALCQQLQLPPTALERVPAHIHRTLLKVGGFNRTWGLPIVQSQAIAAGSVFVYRLQQSLAADRLAALEEDGIGEQRLDGYGSIAVNRLTEPAYQYSDTRTIVLPDYDNGPAVDEAALPLLRRMGERLLRLEIERALLQKVQQLEFSHESICRQSISKSQLARLRLMVRAALEKFYAQQQSSADEYATFDQQAATQKAAAERQAIYRPILRFLDTLRPTAREQFRRTRLINDQGPRLAAWLQEQLGPRDRADSTFLQMTKIQPIHLGATIIELPPIWEAEYTLRLIDGVLAQAAKQMAAAEETTGQQGEER